MADYSTVPPPSSGSAGGGGGGGGGGGVNDAFKDALQRARQIAAKIGGDAGTSLNSNDYGYGGQKDLWKMEINQTLRKLLLKMTLSEHSYPRCISSKAGL